MLWDQLQEMLVYKYMALALPLPIPGCSVDRGSPAHSSVLCRPTDSSFNVFPQLWFLQHVFILIQLPSVLLWLFHRTQVWSCVEIPCLNPVSNDRKKNQSKLNTSMNVISWCALWYLFAKKQCKNYAVVEKHPLEVLYKSFRCKQSLPKAQTS